MAQPDMLLELHHMDSGTKLSIFDDFTTKADISQAGVVSKVASAVKGWQRYRSADSQNQQSGVANAAAAASVCQSEQDSVTGNDSGITAGPDSTSVILDTAAEEVQTSSSVGDLMPTVMSDAAAASLASVCAEARDADAPGQTSEGLASSMVSESGSSAASSAALRKVGFADPDREEVQETDNMTLTGSDDMGKVTREAQQATTADMRARVAAGMRRCATYLYTAAH